MRYRSQPFGGSLALRLGVVVAVATALLVAPAGIVVAGAASSPDPSSAPPAVVDPCTTPVTRVVGRIVWEREEPGAQRFESESGVHMRGWGFTSTLEMDDDRLDGQTTGTADWDASDTAGIARGVRVIENADGRWEGPEIAITKLHDDGVGGLLPGDPARFLDAWDLVGSGAYEGLTATLFLDSDVLEGDYPIVEGSVWPTDIGTCDFAATQ